MFRYRWTRSKQRSKCIGGTKSVGGLRIKGANKGWVKMDAQYFELYAPLPVFKFDVVCF